MGGGSLEQLMELFESLLARAGFGDSDDELQFRGRRGRPPPLLGGGSLERRRAGLVRAQLRLQARRSPAARQGRPRGPPPDGSYELIDYKTGKSKTEDELREDVQLSLYQMQARSWRLEPRPRATSTCSRARRCLSSTRPRLERVKATVVRIADGIMKQEFEPKPSQEVCSCDYRIICPAAMKKKRAAGHLGPFRLERELGRGGMGIVYLAEETSLGRWWRSR